MALKFNGTSDYVDLTNNPLLGSATTPFTVSAWVYFDSVAVNQWVVARDNDSLGRSFAFGCDTTGGAHLNIQVNGSAQIPFDATNALSAGKWYHLLCTGPVYPFAGFQWNSYVNGVGFTGNQSSALVSSTGSTTIGKRTYAGNNDWTQGKIAHVAMWNNYLSPAEIALLASGVVPLAVGSGALIGYWPLSGAQGAWDRGPNEILGTVLGPVPYDDPPFIIRKAVILSSIFAAEGEMPAFFLSGGSTQALLATGFGALSSRASAAAKTSLSGRAFDATAGKAGGSWGAKFSARTMAAATSRGGGSWIVRLAAQATGKAAASSTFSGKIPLAGKAAAAMFGRVVQPGAIALIARAFVKMAAGATATGMSSLQARAKAVSSVRSTAAGKLQLLARAEIKSFGRPSIAAVAPFVAVAGRALITLTARALMIVRAPFTASPRAVDAPAELRSADTPGETRSTDAPPNT